MDALPAGAAWRFILQRISALAGVRVRLQASRAGRLLPGAALGAALSLGLAPVRTAQQAAIAAALAACAAPSQRSRNLTFPADLPFASASLAIAGSPDAETESSAGEIRIEPQTGLEFPAEVKEDGGGRQLAGLGVRKKKLFGLKNLKIYAFGVYVDPKSLYKVLTSKYGSALPVALKESPGFLEDAFKSDSQLGVRLVIFYKGLKIGQVRSAFEDSLGTRIQRISGKPDKELLNSFTKLFKDDFKLERGTTIEISRQPQQVLVTKIGGKEVGRVKSALLCQAFFDLYLGENAFDDQAKDSARTSFAELYDLGARELSEGKGSASS